ncbi:Atonal-like protein 8 [Penaeus vannamei]|uniref:Atonal-like protein 8 n=1 Tax=Penaeus vannamei TaxID=6689 RepID=A0A3R7PVM6_PENVA|nr:Atonal-like protein 8 [Penaeus vannamei]
MAAGVGVIRCSSALPKAFKTRSFPRWADGNVARGRPLPTDASEDSVEVRVQPIRAHHPHRPPTPPTPPAHHKFHKFRKHYSALRQEYPARRRCRPGRAPQPATAASPPSLDACATRRRPSARTAPTRRAPRRPPAPMAHRRLREERASSPSPGAPPLLQHHPLLSSFRRPPMGAFPPLLIPPAWPPVTAQWGYPRVVNPLGWAGLTPGLTPPSARTTTPCCSRTRAEPERGRAPAARAEVSVVRKAGKAPSKFLSVESLIASDSPSRAPADGEDDVAGSMGGDACPPDDDDTIHALLQPSKQKQRNYKNMTRERRIEANARERNRVHTISAAFEKLRTSVPAYSHNQKLSKLSVLRIACSYILSLSRLAGHDYSAGGTEPSFSECVDLTTRTIQSKREARSAAAVCSAGSAVKHNSRPPDVCPVLLVVRLALLREGTDLPPRRAVRASPSRKGLVTP